MKKIIILTISLICSITEILATGVWIWGGEMNISINGEKQYSNTVYTANPSAQIHINSVYSAYDITNGWCTNGHGEAHIYRSINNGTEEEVSSFNEGSDCPHWNSKEYDAELIPDFSASNIYKVQFRITANTHLCQKNGGGGVSLQELPRHITRI